MSVNFSTKNPFDTFAREFVDYFIDSLNPNELPVIEYAEKEIDDIGKHITNKEAAKYLTEFNRVKNLSEVIANVALLTKARDLDNGSILDIAIRRSDLAMMKLIILFEPKLIVEKTKEENLSPLHLAIVFGHEEMVDWLLNPSQLGCSFKADVNANDKGLHTPLHLALRVGFGSIAKKLVAKGANKEALDKDGLTPADHVCLALYSCNKKGKTPAEDPLQKQKYEALMKEFAPARGVLSIEQIMKLLGYVKKV